MKRRKTYKSLAELTADSIGVIEAEPDKAKPEQAQVFADAQGKIPPENLLRVQPVPGFRGWGINE
jgi:hypothetical protein